MPPETPEQQADSRALLAEALWRHKDARPKFEALIKEVFPDAPIPTYEARVQGEQVLAEVRKEREAFRKDTEDERQRRELAEARKRIMDDADLRIRPDEIEAVEKLMQEQLIGTHAAAARLYRAQQQIAAPRTSGGGSMEVPGVNQAGGDEYKGILTDPQWARRKAEQVLNEFRSGSAGR